MPSISINSQGSSILNLKKMNKHTAGFGLVETIVGIVLLGIALTASTMIMNSAINQTQTNHSRIQAIYLGQKCLETARNLRDSAWQKSRPWDCAFVPQQYETARCQDIPTLELATLSSINPVLKEIFTLDIKVQKSSGNMDAINIACSVSWDDETVELSHILTHWNTK